MATEQKYKITAPELVRGMILTRRVESPHPEVVGLVNEGRLLEKSLIKQLEKFGVKDVWAKPCYTIKLRGAVEEVEKMFDLFDQIRDDGAETSDGITFGLNKEQQAKYRKVRGLLQEKITSLVGMIHGGARDALLDLRGSHGPSAVHSLCAALHVMEVGKAMGWPQKKIVRSVMAAMVHDVGKHGIPQYILEKGEDQIGRDQRRFFTHTIRGFNILIRGNFDAQDEAMVAIAHHEWFSEDLTGRGFGGLSTFRDQARVEVEDEGEQLLVDVDAYLKGAGPEQLDYIHATCIGDRVATLEAAPSDKTLDGLMPAFKVMIIMNHDAREGRFSPLHFISWAQHYSQKVLESLTATQNGGISFPREMEKYRYDEEIVNLRSEQAFLTRDDLKMMKLEKAASELGLDLERMERRGGIKVEHLNGFSEKKIKKPLVTQKLISQYGVDVGKKFLVRKKKWFQIDVGVEWISYKGMAQAGLMEMATGRKYGLSEAVIKEKGGVPFVRIINRMLVPSSYQRNPAMRASYCEKKIEKDWRGPCQRKGVSILRKFKLELPAFEWRFNHHDLELLGLLDRIENGSIQRRLREHPKFTLSYLYLRKIGINITRQMVQGKGAALLKKIFYDFRVDSVPAGGKVAWISINREEDKRPVQFSLRPRTKGGREVLLPFDPDLKEEEDPDVFDRFQVDFGAALEIPPDLELEVKQGRHWFPDQYSSKTPAGFRRGAGR